MVVTVLYRTYKGLPVRKERVKEDLLDKVWPKHVRIIVRIQASGPASNFQQPGSNGGVQEVTKPVVDPLPKVNDYMRRLSWEVWTLREQYALVEMVKRVVKITVTGREGIYP